jgi:outer membrane protein assembly factor BamD
LFIGTYPDSKYIANCNSLSDKLRQKLETKAYNSAYLFFKTEEYKAAAISFINFLKDFPETEHKEEAEFYIVKSYYIYAKNSNELKQLERYKQAQTAYQEYQNDFKKDFAKDAVKMNEESGRQIDKLNGVK